MGKIIFSVGVLLVLLACGQPPTNKISQDNLDTPSGPFYITRFSPVASLVSSLPSSILIVFSKPMAATASSVTSYSINCDGNSYTAASVRFVPGAQSVTITLPSISNITTGMNCDISVISNLRDTLGNYISGSKFVRYTII